MGAAGKAATAVAGVQGAADGGRDAAGFASHIQGFAVLVLEQMKQAGIAGEAAHGLGGERGSVLDLAASGSVLVQGLGIDVHDDLVAIGGAGGGVRAGQIALRHCGECIGAPVLEGERAFLLPLGADLVVGNALEGGIERLDQQGAG
jgi:hypothetical protein